MTDEDALDIAQYLASLPPVVHAIDDQCTFPPPSMEESAVPTRWARRQEGPPGVGRRATAPSLRAAGSPWPTVASPRASYSTYRR